ncbi:hypothetical protein WJX81_000359 [Elliptochloris bilobata]|uniref:Kinesin motor domain-containing protein n=1 Tax=Elliptochloris bilobata TaxID=381761 RepID=A0AAW1RB85_9CHLO
MRALGNAHTPNARDRPGLPAPKSAAAAHSHAVHFTATRSRFEQRSEATQPLLRAPGGGFREPLVSSDDNLKVVVRVRPMSERELDAGGQKCLAQQSQQVLKVLLHPEPQVFTFDIVAGEAADQDAIFRVAGRPIVENCMSGYNSCIFAYGQTGSGKTFTMLGPGSEVPPATLADADDTRGLTMRVFEHLFTRISELQQDPAANARVLCRCSFLEIYNEAIADLLAPGAAPLAVREDLRRGVYVEGLCEEVVSSVEEAAALLARGAAARRVGETAMNRESSRSHSVFTLTLETRTAGAAGLDKLLHARLNLVDLAGSERQKASGAVGGRLREASAINRSLSALGNVIQALVEQQKSGLRSHVPYRDSRLTYLLQDSLGGNSKTIMIANVSPAAGCLTETLSTLRFAQRAKNIRNKAVVNVDLSGEAAAMRAEIARLNAEVASFKSELALLQQAPGQAPAHMPAAAGSPFTTPLAKFGTGGPGHGGSPAGCGLHFVSPSGHSALLGALRREAAAASAGRRAAAEAERLRELLRQRDMDAQRAKMIIRLKEDKVARLQAAAAGSGLPQSEEAAAEVAALQLECALLRARVDNHPEVTRFAVEALALREELGALREAAGCDEAAVLGEELAGLRAELLRLADENRRLQSTPKVKEVEAAAQRAAAASASVIEEAMAAAEAARRQASQHTQEQALEVLELRDRVAAMEEAAAGARARLAGASDDVHRLERAALALEERLVAAQQCEREAREEAAALRARADAAGDLAAAAALAEDRERAAKDQAHALAQVLAEREAAASAEEELRSRAETQIVELEERCGALEAAAAETSVARGDLEAALAACREEAAAAIAALRAAAQTEAAQAAELAQQRRLEELETLREELRAQRAIALEGEASRAAAAAAAAEAEAAAANATHERAALAARLAFREREVAAAREDAGRSLGHASAAAERLVADAQRSQRVAAALAEQAAGLEAARAAHEAAAAAERGEADKWRRKYHAAMEASALTSPKAEGFENAARLVALGQI